MADQKITSVKAFIDLVLSKPSNEHLKCVIGKVSDIEVSIIKKLSDIDLTGYVRIIDSYGIKHAIAKHGNLITEIKRGQLPITTNDLSFIPIIVNNPDGLVYDGKNSIGRDIFVYRKNIDGVIFYVEEVRTKRKEVVLQTMYKKKAPKFP